ARDSRWPYGGSLGESALELLVAHELLEDQLDPVPRPAGRGREGPRAGLLPGQAGYLPADQHAGLAVSHEHDLDHVGVPAARNGRLDLAWVLPRRKCRLGTRYLSGCDIGHEISPCSSPPREQTREEGFRCESPGAP